MLFVFLIALFILLPYFYYWVILAMFPFAVVTSMIIAKIKKQDIVPFTGLTGVLFLLGGVLWLQAILQMFGKGIRGGLLYTIYCFTFIAIIALNLNQISMYMPWQPIWDWDITEDVTNELLLLILKLMPMICLTGSIVAFLLYIRLKVDWGKPVQYHHECFLGSDRIKVCRYCSAPFAVLTFCTAPFACFYLSGVIGFFGSAAYPALASAIATVIWLVFLAYSWIVRRSASKTDNIQT